MTIRLTLFICIYIFTMVIGLEKIAEKNQITALFIVIMSVSFAIYLIFKILQEMVSIKGEIQDSVKRKKNKYSKYIIKGKKQ